MGTSYSLVCFAVRRWDHPHACGDKLQVKGSMVQAIGSSPRVWGQAWVSNSMLHCYGIIPTRVGTRTSPFHKVGMYKDHPHACGDKSLGSSNEYRYEGSSPRVWGQAYPLSHLRKSQRIIPTRVGTSILYVSKKYLVQDHPHACGDKYSGDGVFTVWERIIPTRVGTSNNTRINIKLFVDHPHACGDKPSLTHTIERRWGSSPRVWGQAN